MTRLTVNASKSYDVITEKGSLSKVGELISGYISPCRALIAADADVAKLYASRVIHSLNEAGFSAELFAVPCGEEAKTRETLFSLLDHLAENGYTRSDVLLALGGGSTGDTAGLAASLYMRGMRFVQLPTTVVAAVDSSVGGKTAINLETGKNMAGTFYQPDAVICDPEVFYTLKSDLLSDGFAEIIKYAMIADETIFGLLDGSGFVSEDLIFRCLSIKKALIEEDERDSGRRMLLNFGHTAAHAAERASGFALSHGHAVAAGMATFTRAGVKNGSCDRETYDRLVDALEKYGLPTHFDIPADVLLQNAISDKKRAGAYTVLVLPKRVGECYLYKATHEEIGRLITLGAEDL